MHAAVSGITTERNTVISNKNERTTTTATKRGSFALEDVGEVDIDGGRAADEDVDPGAVGDAGDGVGAQAVHQVRRRRGLR